MADNRTGCAYENKCELHIKCLCTHNPLDKCKYYAMRYGEPDGKWDYCCWDSEEDGCCYNHKAILDKLEDAVLTNKKLIEEEEK